MDSLTAKLLRDLYSYNEATGEFTRIRKRRRWPAGQVVGSQLKSGYVILSIDGKKFYAHRLAWLYVHGKWPDNNIDHINGKRNDNRIANLRDVGQKENLLNLQGPNKNNKCGHLGVKPHQGKFMATLCGRYLGVRETPEEAHQLYLTAKNQS